MTASLPTPVPEAPCPGGTTVEQCAAMANWASAEAADATARWIELTLYAEVIGGLAAIVAAGFAGAAFVMTRRGAVASEKQAAASELALHMERERHSAERDAHARAIRPRLGVQADGYCEVSARTNKVSIQYKLKIDGSGTVKDLAQSVRLTVENPTSGEKTTSSWCAVGKAISLQSGDSVGFRVEIDLDPQLFQIESDEWLPLVVEWQLSWRDDSDYQVEEAWEAHGAARYDNTGPIRRPKLLFRNPVFAPGETTAQ